MAMSLSMASVFCPEVSCSTITVGSVAPVQRTGSSLSGSRIVITASSPAATNCAVDVPIVVAIKASFGAAEMLMLAADVPEFLTVTDKSVSITVDPDRENWALIETTEKPVAECSPPLPLPLPLPEP